jgi:hypothetical protein
LRPVESDTWIERRLDPERSNHRTWGRLTQGQPTRASFQPFSTLTPTQLAYHSAALSRGRVLALGATGLAVKSVYLIAGSDSTASDKHSGE